VCFTVKRPSIAWALPVLAGAALPLVALPASAPAQTAAQPAPARSLDAAKKHMERGQELYMQGKYDEASAEFALAYQAQPYAAFLYNEAVCLEKTGQTAKALELLKKYLSADPGAADADKTRARIRRLEDKLAQAAAGPDAATTDAGADAAPLSADAATPAEAPELMKSLVLVESEPSDAPAAIYVRIDPGGAPFRYGQENPAWKRVTRAKTPLNLTLELGRYHVVMEPFADFHQSETDIDVAAGRVHQFKANLRQGEFLALLRVSSPVAGARIYLDDPPPHKKPPWGRTPREGMVSHGEHAIWVERAGFQPMNRKVSVSHGEQREEVVPLLRIERGKMRLEGNADQIELEIDGRPAGTAIQGAAFELELPAGKHELVARSAGRKTLRDTLAVPGGRIQPVDLVMVPKTPRGTAWAAGIASGVFLGGGIVLGLGSNGVYDELERDRTAGTLAAGDDRFGKGKAYAIGSAACFGVAGALAALSAYQFIRDPTPPSGVRLGRAFDYPDEDAKAPDAQPPAAGPSPSGPKPVSERAPRLPTPSPGAFGFDSFAGVPASKEKL
jgi:hypothetical protein